MITDLDHIVLICPDIVGGIEAYSALLGREPEWRAAAGGAATCIFRVENTALELMAPDGGGEVAARLRALIDERGPGLTSLAYRTADIETAHHRLERLGLEPSDITAGDSQHIETGATRHWKRFRCPDSVMAGLKTFILSPETETPVTGADPGAVSRLDHIVIDTPNPDRALALYGAKLGLDLRLDRTREQWQTRFLFFRVGGLTFEVVHRLNKSHDPEGPDKIWGLSWAVEDLAAAHARLSAAGIEVSDIRTGRKPGSNVFTVKSGTLGVPTLFISHTPR